MQIINTEGLIYHLTTEEIKKAICSWLEDQKLPNKGTIFLADDAEFTFIIADGSAIGTSHDLLGCNIRSEFKKDLKA